MCQACWYVSIILLLGRYLITRRILSSRLGRLHRNIMSQKSKKEWIKKKKQTIKKEKEVGKIPANTSSSLRSVRTSGTLTLVPALGTPLLLSGCSV